MGMHQGSGLSPLLFLIVMEAISREFRVALPWELLYADDLAVIAETEEELIKRLNQWKENVESKGMRVNMNKTKVMISGERQMVLQKAARWPCRVCNKGVGSKSLQCTRCQKWVLPRIECRPGSWMKRIPVLQRVRPRRLRLRVGACGRRIVDSCRASRPCVCRRRNRSPLVPEGRHPDSGSGARISFV